MPSPQLEEALSSQIAAAAETDKTCLYSPVCSRCSHLSRPMVCDAFQAIPVSIWRGLDPHSAPWPGDRGIRFEAAPGGGE